eukprot:s265_g3.t1
MGQPGEPKGDAEHGGGAAVLAGLRCQIRKQPSLGDGAKCPECRAQQSQAEDDGDDGDWNICWDFERNDWGSGWKSASTSSWGPTGVPAWQARSAGERTCLQILRGFQKPGDGPFAGDAGASMSPVSAPPWWTQEAAGYTPFGPVSIVSGDGPYMGDGVLAIPSGDAGAPRPVRLTQLPAALPFQGLIPPPPPPGHPFGVLPEADVPRASQASRGAAGGKKPKKRKEFDQLCNPYGGRKSIVKCIEHLGSCLAEPRERRGSDGGRDDDIAREIDSLLSRPGANLQKADFDSGVRRYLGALRGCQNGPQKVKDAMEMLHTYTSQKSREAVKNWPAYLLTLLKRFEPGALNPKRREPHCPRHPWTVRSDRRPRQLIGRPGLASLALPASDLGDSLSSHLFQGFGCAAAMKRPAAVLKRPAAKISHGDDDSEESHNEEVRRKPAASIRKRPAAAVPDEDGSEGEEAEEGEEEEEEEEEEEPKAQKVSRSMKAPPSKKEARAAIKEAARRQKLVQKLKKDIKPLAQKLKEKREELKAAEKELEKHSATAGKLARAIEKEDKAGCGIQQTEIQH